MLYKEPIKDAKRRFRRVYATEADRLAAEEAERKAEKEIFDREWSELEKSRLSKIHHGFKASLIFFGIAFIIYITVILILSIVKTDFPFFNGALIIYASIYFIAFLIYFALTKLRE
jgi:uncharacterized membrane protein YcjF (UPF0283 family)